MYVQKNSRVSETKDQKYSFGTCIYIYIYTRVPPGTINHNVYFASSLPPPMSPRCQLRSMLMHRPETILISSWKLWNVNASGKKSNSYFSLSLSCLSTRIRFFSLPNFLSLFLPSNRQIRSADWLMETMRMPRGSAIIHPSCARTCKYVHTRINMRGAHISPYTPRRVAFLQTTLHATLSPR